MATSVRTAYKNDRRLQFSMSLFLRSHVFMRIYAYMRHTDVISSPLGAALERGDFTVYTVVLRVRTSVPQAKIEEESIAKEGGEQKRFRGQRLFSSLAHL